MRSRYRTRIVILLLIPMLLVHCMRPEVQTRTDHDDLPPGPTPDEIKRCTTDPLKQCVPVPPEVAAKIADPNNLTADDLKLLDELGAVTDGQLQKAITDLDKAAAQFQTDIEAVQKQIGADVAIANKYHAHVDLYGGNSAPAAVPYDNVKLHGLPLSWVEGYYRKHPPMITDPRTLDRRRATDAEVTALIKDLANRPDPYGMSFTKEELDALVTRTEKLRGEDSKDNFLGALAFKSGDVYVVVYGRTDIVVYAKDKDIDRASRNNWVPRLPNNIYRAAYQGRVGTDPGKTLDQRIDQSVARTVQGFRDMKDGEVAAITYLIFSVVPIFATATELDKKLCGQPGSSWLKVAGSFFLDIGFVFTFVPGRLAFGVMLGADGVAVGLLYIDGDPKNMTVIKWQAGFIALALVFRGGPLLRAGINLLGKVPVVTTAIRSYNALLAAFKALNALLKKKCYIFPKKLPRMGPLGAENGSIVTASETSVERTAPIADSTGPAVVVDSDTMDSVETAIDGDLLAAIAAQSADTLDGTSDCVCTDAPADDEDGIVEDALCGGTEGECCYPEDSACGETIEPIHAVSIAE